MMAFFGAFDSPRMRFVPRVEDTFALYKNTLIGMVVVFQIPTLVFVLARLRLVSARFLWRHLNYAVLAAVVASALLTPSTDPWNQLVFAAPMVAMYVIGIGIAWLARPRAGLGRQREERVGAWARGRGQCVRAGPPSSVRGSTSCRITVGRPRSLARRLVSRVRTMESARVRYATIGDAEQVVSS